ncbi:hypothetical protein BHM03_00010392 [Ensete ventricosum]|nr:hypothetical protein BHM03_00010392 [Ensete ventricosum]
MLRWDGQDRCTSLNLDLSEHPTVPIDGFARLKTTLRHLTRVTNPVIGLAKLALGSSRAAFKPASYCSDFTESTHMARIKDESDKKAEAACAGRQTRSDWSGDDLCIRPADVPFYVTSILTAGRNFGRVGPLRHPKICPCSPIRCSFRQMQMNTAHNDNSRGSLIVLEGLDRSGKTSQSNRLVTFLKEKGLSVELWRFPDRSTSTGQMISAYLANESQLDDRAIHLLFSANRWEKR